MVKTKTIAITLLLIAVNTAAMYGVYALGGTQPNGSQVPQSYEWARDTALEYLEVSDQGGWHVTSPNNGLIGATTKIYTSGDLHVTVSHNLNPTAAFMVTVNHGGNEWSLWVQQDGAVQTIN